MNENTLKKTWDDLNIKDNLLRGIYSYGFEVPSEIQKNAITPIVDGKDIIAQAQSGSGKTGAFTIGTLQSIVLERGTQALIIAPTHELVNQIADVITSIGSKMSSLVVKTVIGGSFIGEDISYFRNTKPHVIVGSTGRVLDLIRRGCIDTRHLNLVVLDEADELLSTGFKEDVYNIFQNLNNNIQIAMFSATLSEDVLRVTEQFMRNPTKIIVQPDKLNVEGIEQFFIAVNDDSEKYEMIKRLFSTIVISQCIIYVNSVKRVVDLSHSLSCDGYTVSSIHGSMTKQERDIAFTEFKSGKSRLLISSNITARGIDIQQVGVVVNLDISQDVNTYLHRIGRSGRYGRKGVAINFVTKRDVNTLKQIERFYNISINEYKF
jgi:translation initiation factor 4A